MDLDLLIILTLLSCSCFINGQTTNTYDDVYEKVLQCQAIKIPNKALIGNTPIEYIFRIESESHCISLCWIYKLHGKNCNSVNYAKTEQLCKLFQEVYEPGRPTSKYTTYNWDIYDYIIVQKCIGASAPSSESLGEVATAPITTKYDFDMTNNYDYYTTADYDYAREGPTIFSGTCGKTIYDPLKRRIVGGEIARAHSIPWIISMRKLAWHGISYLHTCGGTLIRVNEKDETDIAITAAHCVTNGDADFEVAAGVHYKNETAIGEVRVPASKVVIHPDYNAVQRYSNDIAIIKLSRPIKFSRTIQPACLPKKGEILSEGTNGIVAGWGKLEEKGSSPTALNMVLIPVVGHTKCQERYGSALIEDSMMCGGVPEGGKDSCQGDSGGPYLFKQSNGYTLHGVVSWGYGCARPGTPGIYARVSTYIDWIQEQKKALSEL